MPSSPFCSLASTCRVLPAEATCWPSNHAVHGKGGAKRPFSPSAQVLAHVLLAFSVTRDWCLQQPPLSCFMSFTSTPPVRFRLSTQRWGRGEPAPTQFLSGYHRQDPGAGHGLRRRGSLREPLPVPELWARAIKTLVRDESALRDSVACNVGRGKGLP